MTLAKPAKVPYTAEECHKWLRRRGYNPRHHKEAITTDSKKYLGLQQAAIDFGFMRDFHPFIDLPGDVKGKILGLVDMCTLMDLNKTNSGMLALVKERGLMDAKTTEVADEWYDKARFLHDHYVNIPDMHSWRGDIRRYPDIDTPGDSKQKDILSITYTAADTLDTKRGFRVAAFGENFGEGMSMEGLKAVFEVKGVRDAIAAIMKPTCRSPAHLPERFWNVSAVSRAADGKLIDMPLDRALYFISWVYNISWGSHNGAPSVAAM